MLKPMNHAMNVPILDLASVLLGTLSRSVRHPIRSSASSVVGRTLAGPFLRATIHEAPTIRKILRYVRLVGREEHIDGAST